MSEGTELRYEVVKENGTALPLLHVYLPEGMTSSDMDVNAGAAEVCIEHIETKRVLALIRLKDYSVPQDDSVVKYSKKNRRYTIRLAQVAAASPNPTANPSSLASEAPGATSSTPQLAAPPASPSAPLNPNSFSLLENDDISDEDARDGGGESVAGGGKKKKKKKKGKKATAAGEEPGEMEAPEVPSSNGNHVAAGASSGDEIEVASHAAGGEGATGLKKKKKKKKKGAAASTAEGGVDAGGTEQEADVQLNARIKVSGVEVPLPGRSSIPPTPPPTPLEPVVSLPSAPDFANASSTASGPTSKTASRAMTVDMVADFGSEKSGSFEVGAVVAQDPLLGPAVHSSLGKVVVKSEDMWLEAPTNSWTVEGLEGAVTPVSAFGIFDGHGGRMAAQHAAKGLLSLVARFAERVVGPELPIGPKELAAEGYLDTDVEIGMEPVGAAVQKYDAEALARARVAAAQDALIARLPKAFHAAFVECDEEVITRHKSSGTTATLAVQVGWELLVASVGDSLAYLDTGTEIVVISDNHRVAASPEEQERIRNAGGRIQPAKYSEEEDAQEGAGSGKPEEGQQLRVWPGGINMTRSIGDAAAGKLLIPEPAIRQISLPVTGARLIIASDGLWDAVTAKTVIGQLRTCNTREAAAKAAVYAMRKNKNKYMDDVTVVIADFVPRDIDTYVPGLLKRSTGPAAAAVAALAATGMREERAAQCWKPLEAHSQSWRERHRAHRHRAALYLKHLSLAEQEAQETADELERQRRAAVPPAAGTAGVGTAVRPPPVSETYRELAELKIPPEALLAEEDPDTTREDWTQVDAKKKRDGGGGGFDMQQELVKAARPEEVRAARLPGGGGGGGRHERHDGGGGGRHERHDGGGGGRHERHDGGGGRRYERNDVGGGERHERNYGGGGERHERNYGGGGERHERNDGGSGERHERNYGGGGGRHERNYGGGGRRYERNDAGGGKQHERYDSGSGGGRLEHNDGGGGGRLERNDGGGGGRLEHNDGGSGRRLERNDGGGGGRHERNDGGGGGRRERRDRGGNWDREQRRPPRSEHDNNAAPAVEAGAGTSEVLVAVNDGGALENAQPQSVSRGERRERIERRDRGSRGSGRTREGYAGGHNGPAPVTVEALEAGNAVYDPATTATGAAGASMPPGVVKTGGVLCVPKSVLTGSNASTAAPVPSDTASVPLVSVGNDEVEGRGNGKPRRERPLRGGIGGGGGNSSSGPRPRRGDATERPYAVPDVSEGEQYVVEPTVSVKDDGAGPSMSRGAVQKRRPRGGEKEAATAALRGPPAGSRRGRIVAPIPGLPQPAQTHVLVSSTSDPVAVLEPVSSHHQRRQQHAEGTSHTAAAQEKAAAASHSNRPGAKDHHGDALPAKSSPPLPVAKYALAPARQQQQSQTRSQGFPQEPTAQVPQQQRASVSAAPAATQLSAVPTYTGPLDFGAGFGSGSNMWAQPSAAGGQYSGFSANGGAAVPQRPPGLSGGPAQRNPAEVAAAAAAAAAASMARKAVAARAAGRA